MIPAVALGAVSPQLWTGVGLALTFLYLMGAGVLIATGDSRWPEQRPWRGVEMILCAAILLAAASLRFRHVETLNGGLLTMDEAQTTRTYVSSVVHFEPAEFGATFLTHAWLLDTWYRVFGIGTYSPRYFTAVVGLIGLLFFFATLRLLFGAFVAAWGTAFLAVATYAVYLSVFAIETGTLMLAVPVGAFAFVAWLRGPTLLRSCALGLAIGLSLFTYPGVLVGYAAIVGGWVLCAAVQRFSRRANGGAGPLALVPARSWGVALLSLAVVFLAALILHVRVYAPTHGLFHGGGSLSASAGAFRAAMPALLRDLFVETDSWNLLLRRTPFVDWTYWPFAVLGAACVWKRYPDWISRGVLLSMVLVVLLVPLCGSNPGMRRGAFLLFPLCACAGVGVGELRIRVGSPAASVLVLAALAHPIYFQTTIGRGQWTTASFGQSFGSKPIPDRMLLDILEKHDVVMSADEYASSWDRNRLVHYRKLALRHGALPPHAHTLGFADAADPSGAAAVAAEPGAALLTWDPERVLPAIAGGAGLCIGPSNLDERPALVPLIIPGRATSRDVCLWRDGPLSVPSRCVRLGHAHRFSKLAHDVSCENAYCDASRPEAAYVEPGSVAFRLGAPPPRAWPVRLVVQVTVLPPWARENRVFVNERDIGAIDGAGLDAAGRLRIDVPSAAAVDREQWSVRLGPGGHPGRLGWDVVWAALVAKDEGEVCTDDGAPSAVTVPATPPQRRSSS